MSALEGHYLIFRVVLDSCAQPPLDTSHGVLFLGGFPVPPPPHALPLPVTLLIGFSRLDVFLPLSDGPFFCLQELCKSALNTAEALVISSHLPP